MSTTTAHPLDVIFAGAGNDSTKRHNTALANLKLEHEVLRCTLAAQEKFETIRTNFAALHSLVHNIQELKANNQPSRGRKDFMSRLIEQEMSLNYLAATLDRVLE